MTAAAQTRIIPEYLPAKRRNGKKWNTTKDGPGAGFSFEKWRMPAIIETASSAGNVLTFSRVIASYHRHGKIKNNSTE